MKKKHLLITLALALTLCLGMLVGAAAAGTTANISAILDYGATVELNGVPQNFLDANGDRIYLINYNGSMYLPVRKTAELVGLDVDWDGATHTVKLGNTKDVNLIDDIGAYFLTTLSDTRYMNVTQVKSDEGKTYNISGTEVTNYLKFFASQYLNLKAWPLNTTLRSSFNLAGKYESVTFKYYSTQDAVLRVYADDDSLQKEIQVKGGQVAQEVTVPLFGTQELTFEFQRAKNGVDTNLYIFNTTVKPIQQ